MHSTTEYFIKCCPVKENPSSFPFIYFKALLSTSLMLRTKTCSQINTCGFYGNFPDFQMHGHTANLFVYGQHKSYLHSTYATDIQRILNSELILHWTLDFKTLDFTFHTITSQTLKNDSIISIHTSWEMHTLCEIIVSRTTFRSLQNCYFVLFFCESHIGLPPGLCSAHLLSDLKKIYKSKVSGFFHSFSFRSWP